MKNLCSFLLILSIFLSSCIDDFGINNDDIVMLDKIMLSDEARNYCQIYYDVEKIILRKQDQESDLESVDKLHASKKKDSVKQEDFWILTKESEEYSSLGKRSWTNRGHSVQLPYEKSTVEFSDKDGYKFKIRLDMVIQLIGTTQKYDFYGEEFTIRYNKPCGETYIQYRFNEQEKQSNPQILHTLKLDSLGIEGKTYYDVMVMDPSEEHKKHFVIYCTANDGIIKIIDRENGHVWVLDRVEYQ